MPRVPQHFQRLTAGIARLYPVEIQHIPRPFSICLNLLLVFPGIDARFKSVAVVILRHAVRRNPVRLPHQETARFGALKTATTTKELTMPTGTVKWFNTTKGYGFIAPEEGGKDVFVHISAVERAGMTGLADDQKVSFELIEGRDGRQMAGELKSA